MGKRMKVLGARRTTVIVTLAVLLLAVAVVIGSGANFTSTSSNPDNTFSAAKFRIDNDRDAEKIIDVEKMKPGDAAGPEAVTIWLDSDVEGAVSLVLDDITDAFPVGGAALSALLTVRIYDVTLDQDVYDGPLTAQTWALPGTGGANWAADETHDFEITVSWPDGAPADDNLRKSATTTFDLTWSAVSL